MNDSMLLRDRRNSPMTLDGCCPLERRHMSVTFSIGHDWEEAR